MKRDDGEGKRLPGCFPASIKRSGISGYNRVYSSVSDCEAVLPVLPAAKYLLQVGNVSFMYGGIVKI